MVNKKCKQCGKSLINMRSDAIFCCHNCYYKFWKSQHKTHLKKYKRRYYTKNNIKIRSHNRAYTMTKLKTTRENNKRYVLKNKKKISNRLKQYNLLYPERYKAKWMAQYKTLLKKKCELCGRIDLRLERHHWRYDKPYFVNTLCKSCHAIQHVKNKK